MFFNSLAGKCPMVFGSLTSDALLSSENTRSIWKDRLDVMIKEVPDPVPVMG